MKFSIKKLCLSLGMVAAVAGNAVADGLPDPGVEFSKGGSASKRADGIAQRGKTRGKVY